MSVVVVMVVRWTVHPSVPWEKQKEREAEKDVKEEFLLFAHDRTAIKLKAKMSQEFKLATEMMGGGEGDDEVGVVEVYAETQINRYQNQEEEEEERNS